MISGRQIRAARALLNYSQNVVADTCGLDKSTLSQIENEHSQGKAASVNALQAFYENRGVEFIDGDGVRLQRGGIRRYQGAGEFREFFDDIYETAKSVGGDICLFNGVPTALVRWLGQSFYIMHAERMAKIKGNFRFRVIIEETDSNLIGASFATYRWFPRDLFRDRTIYVYGGKVGILSFRDDDVQVVVIDQAEFAESLLILFEIAWETVAREIGGAP